MQSKPQDYRDSVIKNLKKRYKKIFYYDFNKNSVDQLEKTLLKIKLDYNEKTDFPTAVYLEQGEIQSFLPQSKISLNTYTLYKLIQKINLHNVDFIFALNWGPGMELQIKNFLQKKEVHNRYKYFNLIIPNKIDPAVVKWKHHLPLYKFCYVSHTNRLHRTLFAKFCLLHNLHQENLIAFTDYTQTYPLFDIKTNVSAENKDKFSFVDLSEDNWITSQKNIELWDSVNVSTKSHHLVPKYDLEIYQPYQEYAYFTIISETVFNYPYPRLTEKVYSVMLSKRPFILFAPANTLRYLKEIGFKTFEGIIDEHYDTIEDPDSRFSAVCDLISNLNGLPTHQFEKIFYQCQNILKHNLKHLIKLSNTNVDLLLELNNI